MSSQKREALKKKAIFTDTKIGDSLSAYKDSKTINISINKDSINFKRLKVLLDEALSRKEFNVPYTLNYYKKDTLYASAHKGSSFSNHFSVKGKSTYLKTNEVIELQFSNAVIIVLKKSVFSIMLSLIISVAIVFTLFYILWMMNTKTQNFELKNDLISNNINEIKTTSNLLTEKAQTQNILLDLNKEDNDILIGCYKFSPKNQTLQFKDENKENLTSKESQLLLHLAQHINEAIDRNLVLEQLWGNANFYSARSMDVFISKLRKRLSRDNSIKILNVWGIGYKLIV